MNDILKRAKEGESQALEELIHMYEIKMYKTAKTILNCEDDINEAIQQTIILVYNKINQLKNDKSFGTWIMKILVNQCKKIWNQNNKRDEKHIELEDNIKLTTPEKEDYSFVNKAMEKLSDEYKEVTILYYYDEFSIKEISKILNIPKGTVKSRLAIARQTLSKLLKEEVQ